MFGIVFNWLNFEKKTTIFQDKVIHNSKFIIVHNCVYVHSFGVNIFAMKAINNKTKCISIDYKHTLFTVEVKKDDI